ncbi:MAG: tetratricopeptide repeat protein [Alphaproteobacteria bacterium]|nr:tetratricopeptide repeat protein [Alphaproteobacteria bacterium]MCB9697778.1 tetratricopeptide repeat protein [Alphaproteobacteria bacterium]
MSVRRLLLALALLPGAAVAGPRSADRVAADASEVEAFRATSERFAGRMTEIADDTKAFVDFREGEERAMVDARFRGPLEDLENKQREQRTLTIGRFETFLANYPEQAYTNHVRFRLAELYYEVATEDWQAASARYFEKLEDPNLPIEEMEALGEAPRRDLSKAIALYGQIIESNRGLSKAEQYERLDGTYLMLGFVYNDPNAVQYDPQKAKETFAELIRAVPDSELADRSHLFLGNFLFADNEFDPALAEYRLVYDKGGEGKYFEEALYQLAWAEYKLNHFDESLRLFTELLDLSEQKKLDAGRESAFAPDARRFMAFSFADIAYDKDANAHEIAASYFAGIGGRPYERDVYIELTDVLERYVRIPEALATYEKLQTDPRWKLESDNPEHQIAVIDLYINSVVRDLEAAGSERLEFIDTYAEGTPWWDANRNDPEALQVARQFIESSLLEVAIEYRVRAQESGNPADYLLAAKKYQEYLDKFPISDDYYKQQYYYADSMKLAGEYDVALSEFQSLLKTKKYHPYGDAALYSIFDVRLQLMKAANHVPDEPPTDAPVERTYTAGDKEIQVFGLTSDRKDFIDAADSVMAHKFVKTEDEELPDYQAEVDRLRPSVLYLTGQVMYYHNRYDDARKRFLELIDKFPRTVEANYAAGLIVDSYLAEGNLAEVRSYSKRFTMNPPGPAQDIDPERFSGTLEGTTFKLYLEQAETGDPTEVAESFIDFRKEFPKSQFGPDALYNAAYYYQQAGKVAKSNELYEQFVRENPNDKRSLGLYFRIAANYEAAFELDDAIDYYDRILRHPNASSSEKADAQYNKSFLQIGLKRHREAAEGYEAYERSYPDQADKEEIYFRAGEQWEEVSTNDAVDFYQRYKRKYPDASADRTIQADYRLLKLYEKQGAESWKITKQREAIVSDFERFARAGKPIGAIGHEYAAAAEYPVLEKAFDTYSKDKLSGKDEKDMQLLTERKPAELKQFEDQVKAFVSKYQNFEYNSGALLLQARAALYLADLGLSIKCPRQLSEEDCWLYEDILQEKIFPQFYAIEEVGVRRLGELTQAAKDAKKHSRFVDEAMAELNRRDPGKYPAVKDELTGGTDASMPVDLHPQRMKTKEPEPAPEPAPAPAPAPQETP